MSPRTAIARAIHTAVIHVRFGAAAGLTVECNVCCVAIVVVLTKAGDEMGVDPVRIEPASHEVAGAHPGPAGPLPERDPRTGCAGGSWKHLHALERFLHSTWAQRMSVGEGVQQRRGD